MSCDIAKLINEYELAAKKFRYSESQEWFELKCKTYEAIVKAVTTLEAENERLLSRIFEFETVLPNGDLGASFADMDKRLQKLEAENASLRERLAGYEWIPVSERLPEDGKSVLVANDRGHVFVDYRYENGMVVGVTHWMPLPSAPKEEE